MEDHEAAYAAACAQAAAGELEAARDAFISLRARLEQPSANLELQLGVVHLRMGDRASATRVLQDALTLDPTLFHAHALLARLRADEGDAAGAEASLREAERHAGPEAGQWRELGQMHAEYWRWDDADRALARADDLEPSHGAAASLAAIVKAERGDDAGARQVLERALARDPSDLAVALAYNLFLPQVYESVEDVERWRARYSRGLAEIVSEPHRWKGSARQALELNRTNFLLAYQGGDDRELQRGYSQLLTRLALAARPDWRELARVRAPGKRLRVGFVGSIFRECTAGRYFEHWITGLDARRFERVVFYTGPVVDEVTRRIAAGCDAFTTLRAGGEETIDRLREAGLDVLVQPEVGMTPLSYLLAAVRVAPVQCAGWGHPVTTGGDATDHYFTCAAMEPGDGATHYTERLVGLPGLGVLYPLPAPAEPFARDKLRLPADRRLYACPQSLFKIHPAMDAVFADILERDPGGVLLFFQSTGKAVSERFAARLQRALASRGIEPAGQVKFLPRMNAEAFRRVLAAADAVVDTVHWSGGNTSLDAIAAGTPMVTLPGRFMRGRQSAAMLREMGLDELVAGSEGELAARLVEVARDPGQNRALRERIAAGRGALFGRTEPIAAFAEALLARAPR